jgi:hypothetical protein
MVIHNRIAARKMKAAEMIDVCISLLIHRQAVPDQTPVIVGMKAIPRPVKELLIISLI